MSAAEKATSLPGDTHEREHTVGARLRERRLALGITQEKLGNLLGLTFQQVQKYERGINRISASRLYDIARLLQVPVGFFYDDEGAQVGFGETQQAPLEGDTPSRPDHNAKETAELLNLYYQIEDEEKRRRILALIRDMAGN